MKYIYVVVELTYDYYEFQENLFVSSNLKKCKDWISKQEKYKNWPIVYFTYDQISKDYGATEIKHLCIERWDTNGNYINKEEISYD